jgi:hypothetical protein
MMSPELRTFCADGQGTESEQDYRNTANIFQHFRPAPKLFIYNQATLLITILPHAADEIILSHEKTLIEMNVIRKFKIDV